VADLIVKRFDTPDERQEFAFGYYELLTVGAMTMGREFLEPGWKWSTHVKPIVGTEWCEVRHVGFQVSGQWVCASRDGTEVVIGPGDAFDVPAGHDSWVLGDEPSVTIDFQGSDYAAAADSAGHGSAASAGDTIASTKPPRPIAARIRQRSAKAGGGASKRSRFSTFFQNNALLRAPKGLRSRNRPRRIVQEARSRSRHGLGYLRI